MLEQNKKNRYTPAYPMQFFYINVGFKGVFIAWTCFPDANRRRSINKVNNETNIGVGVIVV